jgi:5-methylcytosine-specific restriction endonuclease McrA
MSPGQPRHSRPAKVAWGRLYKTAQWRALRRAQLQREPLCAMCTALGVLRAATVVDHIQPHRGRAGLFYSPTNLQSLCKAHHDSTKQRWERLALTETGADGWPAEPSPATMARPASPRR